MGTPRNAPPDSLSVVVIDDEADVAAYLAAVLERRGHVPRIAHSAGRGFAIMKEIRPDVACIDIVMPEETGVALLRRIRGDDEVSDTPVVFITALKPELAGTNGTDPDHGTPQPDAYLEKPPDADTFVAAVERVARERRVRK
jgi:CheY-like chemotaxis protein